MTKEEIEAVFVRVRTWPLKRQSQVATYLQAIEKFGDELWPLADEDITELMAEWARDDVASDEEVAATFGGALR